MQFLCVRKQKQSDSFLNPQVSLRCWYLFSMINLYYLSFAFAHFLGVKELRRCGGKVD